MNTETNQLVNMELLSDEEVKEVRANPAFKEIPGELQYMAKQTLAGRKSVIIPKNSDNPLAKFAKNHRNQKR